MPVREIALVQALFWGEELVSYLLKDYVISEVQIFLIDF